MNLGGNWAEMMRRGKKFIQARRNNHLQDIRGRDPVSDHCAIVFLDAAYEFPFEIARALEFALFRSYAVPRISGLLRKSGELMNNARKRYDDTDLILSELIENGYDSERGMAAIANMNQQHSRYPIHNDDYLYVLSTFVFEPIRWIDRFGHRAMIEQERLSWFLFWRAVGERMGIHNIPEKYGDFEDYNICYERDKFRFARSNHTIATKTRDLLLEMYLPRVLFPIGRLAVYAMLDESMSRAFGFPVQRPTLRLIIRRLLYLRGKLVRCLPARQKPVLRTQKQRPTYPEGYCIKDLGPDHTDNSIL